MKKLLFVLALGAFAACGTAEPKAEETTVDSPAVVAPDTTAPAVTAPDTTAAMPDTTAAAK